MAYDGALVERVRTALDDQTGITEQKMFGGLAFMLRGNLVVGVNTDGLLVRVGPRLHDEAMARPGAQIFEQRGQPMTGWLRVSPEALKTPASLRRWLEDSLAFAGSLPPKEAGTGKPASRTRKAG